MRMHFMSPQGGMPVVNLMISLARDVALLNPTTELTFSTLLDSEVALIKKCLPEVEASSFESFVRAVSPPDSIGEIERVCTDYPEANWSAVIASERSFVDASLLQGGAGHRSESREYVETLLVNFIRFFESTLVGSQISGIVCPTTDTMMTFAMYKVAAARNIKLLGMQWAWINETGSAGFFGSDEFVHCDRMLRAYADLAGKKLNEHDVVRVDTFMSKIIEFDAGMAYASVKKKNFGRSALSPNVKRIISYLRENARRDKDIEFFKIDPMLKIRANLLRLWRRKRSVSLLGPSTAEIPPHSVFYPMHYQPEQSTLVGGILFANQIGLIEAISKSLPLGYTLVVKEHPAGRGARPVWQYRHIQHFPNVLFCDARSIEIAQKCDAVVTITGSIGMEAMAMDKPVILFGDCVFDYAGLLYKTKSFGDLASLLRKILIDRDYDKRTDRLGERRRFFLSYLRGLIPGFPIEENSKAWAAQILNEVQK
jgi:Capsule polysaccharide biosynthesis protein